MSGSLVQLVAQGVQDTYLTSNPEVSFFKQVYRRHTNFASKPLRLDYIGTAAANNEVTVKIPNKGDLLTHVWVDLGTGNVDDALKASDENGGMTVELYIGGQLIDRQDAFFMIQLWNKFLVDQGSKAFACMTSTDNDVDSRTNVLASTWFPLHFFFCDGFGLPLVALQYHEVEIHFRFSSGASIADKFNVYANYVMLDTVERDAVVNTKHDILIEQMQKIQSDNTKFDLNLLNHPVKALMWGNPNIAGSVFTTDDVQIYLNGTELFGSPMPDKYFTYVQPYYASEYASELMKGSAIGSGSSLKMYSFAQKASRHQPTGSCNFSRLDNSTLHIGTIANAPASLYMYAVNYNILHIEGGMAGVAFSN